MKTSSLSKKHISDSFKNLPERVKTSFRDSRVWGFFLSMAVLAIVSVVFFMPDNFEGHTLQQHDQVQGAANGHEGQVWEAETGEKALWTNSLFSGMPTFQISPSYPSNALFTWLGKIYGLGLPAPSNLLFMMMFGFLIMMACLKQRWWYGLIGALAWGLSSYFIIIIGAGHIWKFFALTYVPPTIGGLIMIYKGRKLAGTALLALFAMLELNANHPQISYYFAFLMAFLVIAFLVSDGIKGRIKSWLESTALVLVAGALAIGANLPSLYNTYEYSKETKRAASELTPLPSADADKTPAERPTGGLPKSEIGGWSNLPDESFSLLIPNIKGGATIRPEGGKNELMSLDRVEDLNPAYFDAQPTIQTPDGHYQTIPVLSQTPQYFGGKGLTNGPFYVGALIFALFILGCFIVPGALKWVLLVSTIFSVLLAMGNHFEAFTDFMIYNVPLYNKFRAAETALVIACLCMPLLAMLALRKLMTTENPMSNRQIRIGFTFGFTLPLLVCLLAYFKPEIFGPAISDEETAQFTAMIEQVKEYYHQDISAQVEATVMNIQQIRFDIVSADAGRSFFIILIGGGVLILACLGRIRRGVALVAVGAIVTVDLFAVDKRYIDSDSFTSTLTAYDPLAADAIDNEILKDKDYYRVIDYNEFGGARRSYYHHMVGGYHAAKLNRYNDLIERSNGFIADGQPAYNLLSMLNTRYIIVPGPNNRPEYFENPENLGPAWLVDSIQWVNNADEEMAAVLRLDPTDKAVIDRKFASALEGEFKGLTDKDYIKLDNYTPNQLTYTVNSENGGLAVFSEVWFPWGWSATIDGKEAPLVRANYVLRALRVPAGKHTVVMSFDPASLHVTGAIAYGSVTIIYLLCAAALFLVVISIESKHKEKKDEESA